VGGDRKHHADRHEAEREPPWDARGTRVIAAIVAGIVAGLLHALALRAQWGWLVAWVALVPLLRVAERGVRARTVAATVAYAVTLALAEIVRWLVPALPRYFGIEPRIAGIAGTAGIALLAVAHGLVLAVLLVRRRRVRPALGVVWCAACWSAWEALRTALAPYFPACILGVSQAGALPVLQLASVTGIAGVTGLVAAVNAAIAGVGSASGSRARRLGSLAAAVGVALAVVAWGAARIDRTPAPDGPIRVLLVDGAAATAGESTLERYVAASRPLPGDVPTLVVWPESALTVDPTMDPEAWRRLRSFVDGIGTTLVTGGVGSAVAADGRILRFNSVHVVRPAHGMRSYHKRLLVPFAESWPEALGTPPAGLEPVVAGRELGVFGDGPERFGTVICFEIADPATLRSLARADVRFVVSVNNDVWWAGAAPHLVWAVVRAVESGLPIVRATNHGTSAVVDPAGRLLATARSDGRSSMLASALPQPVRTAYARTGEVFVPACVLVVVVGLLPRPRRFTGPGSMAGRRCRTRLARAAARPSDRARCSRASTRPASRRARGGAGPTSCW
jgi:apolipoprotein N-acyltransferase